LNFRCLRIFKKYKLIRSWIPYFYLLDRPLNPRTKNHLILVIFKFIWTKTKDETNKYWINNVIRDSFFILEESADETGTESSAKSTPNHEENSDSGEGSIQGDDAEEVRSESERKEGTLFFTFKNPLQIVSF